MIVKHNGSPIVLPEWGTTPLLITKSNLPEWPEGRVIYFIVSDGLWYYRKQWGWKVNRIWLNNGSVDFSPLTLAYPADPNFTLDKLDELL